ncbi:1-(5-phosphoribosyl)-5-[(5-phosphoribosylamino)methylideneamino]imidazole-4-carboxamide isomerase [Taibaiella soli]|uniref:1-(5-phosphoribosyl)-5-[(5-phosphoribosylamino)methylideneamino] imidazole-4-carboxamide isomerase n=1 Tax=Taibaiella soli TaxID=1649169 RepID=A0A2W2B105_9BACT|nr:1-(5-phosphoribosyl)-5-[(5-phosphoribosylamino)methylideneamino]imidazole-4-carboxamide isomerase [Taibaiella soli]PZF73924.1 1-(5-phosphoribosyl)-5-[(5-phosphoribosylamino)methylideneamino]imidazole-4-carboxamide isomerase [Taibaiella soli]
MINIIPAIDLIAGNAVRLSQGNFQQQTVYSSDPVEVAKRFEAAGLTHLHLVDLDGAKSGKVQQLYVLESIAKATDLSIDFSGGIKTSDDLSRVFDAGASVAALGSIAVKNPELLGEWLGKYSGEKIWLGIDVLQDRVMINGWQQDSEMTLFQLLDGFYGYGLKNIFCTSIERDGMLQGPSIAMYQQIEKRYKSLNVIASGGVASIDNILALEEAGCDGVIIGKAFYEGHISLASVSKMILDNGAY